MSDTRTYVYFSCVLAFVSHTYLCLFLIRTCFCFTHVLTFISYVYLRSSMILNRDEDASDTESTSDEREVGGDGNYSHGDKCLTHQHWVDQIISSGAFAVHDTEGPEAVHKVCMRLASSRVRHLDVVNTKESMLDYLKKNLLFTSLQAGTCVICTYVLVYWAHTYLR